MSLRQWGVHQLPRDVYASLIQQCGSARALPDGRSLHSHIATFGLDRQTFLGNLLVKMYGQCGSLPDALSAFSQISHPNVVSHNILLSAYAQNGHLQHAWNLFNSLPLKNVISWTTMLSSYAQRGCVDESRDVFAKMPCANVVSWNAMLSAYAQYGDVFSAWSLFISMPERDHASWNGMIHALVTANETDQAEDFFARMPAKDVVCSTALIAAYAQNGQSSPAKELFDSLPEHNTISSNAMMNAFAQSGSVSSARDIFDGMPYRSVSSWNVLMQAYAENGEPETAAGFFQAMPQWDAVSWSVAVDVHAEMGNLSVARNLADESPDSSLSLCNMLLQVYARNGYLEEAETLFYSMTVKDPVSWTAMIGAYAHNGCIDKAVEVFQEMPRKDLISWTAVVTAYAQRGYMENANSFFQAMPCWDVVAWNAMLAAYGEDEDYNSAKSWFDRMPGRNGASWNAMISAAVENDSVEDAREVFDKVPVSEAPVWNMIIQMYVSHGFVEEAGEIFDRMPVPDSVAWTTMINAHANRWPARDIIRNLCKIDLEGLQADDVLFAAVLDACGSQQALAEGKCIHAELLSWFDLNNSELLTAAVINMYGKCERLDDARFVFDNSSLSGSHTALWTSMISACVLNAVGAPGLELFRGMLMEGLKPDSATFNAALDACGLLLAAAPGRAVHASITESGLESYASNGVALISMYSKCGCLDEASRAFEKVTKKNLFVRTAMISAYAHSGHGRLALKHFVSMDLEGIQPDQVTYISALDACASISAITEGKIIHQEILASSPCMEFYPQLWNAILSLYSKCGAVEEARKVFEKLPDVGVVSSSAMLGGYAQNGHGKETLEFFRLMQLQGVQPEAITFLSIFSACSHAGLVEQGRDYFASMEEDYDVGKTMEHFTCMVDLLARAGKVEEAEELIESMPFESQALGWMSLLAACKSSGHADRGARAAARAVELGAAQSSAPYILLSSMPASVTRLSQSALSFFNKV